MRNNPVLQESFDVFFGEGHGFAAYFYLLIILAPIEFISLSVAAATFPTGCSCHLRFWKTA